MNSLQLDFRQRNLWSSLISRIPIHSSESALETTLYSSDASLGIKVCGFCLMHGRRSPGNIHCKSSVMGQSAAPWRLKCANRDCLESLFADGYRETRSSKPSRVRGS